MDRVQNLGLWTMVKDFVLKAVANDAEWIYVQKHQMLNCSLS